MKNSHIIGLVLVAVVILLNLPPPVTEELRAGSRDGVEPFQSIAELLLYRIRSIGSDGGRATPEEQARISELEIRVRELENLESENARLRENLGLMQRSQYQLIPAEVISRDDISGWWRTVRLSSGSQSGIETNMAVLASGGLIGKVQSVSQRTADVLLITDSSSRVSVRLRNTNIYGILRGTGFEISKGVAAEVLYPMSELTVDYISKTADVPENSPIVTSGQGGVFPEGLPVGKIRDVRVHESGLYRVADLDPEVNLNGLRFVFVVKPVLKTEAGATP